MTFVRITSFALALLLATQSARAATVLTTGAASNATAIRCTLMNISKKEVAVTIEALDNGSNVVYTTEANELVKTNAEIVVPGATWCRFTIANASAKGVRAIAFYDDGGGFKLLGPAY
jgi:hypothetical protein